MIFALAGSLLGMTIFQEIAEVEPHPQGAVVQEVRVDTSERVLLERYQLEPLAKQQFRNLVRQAYDYSCGAASLTTILRYYLGVEADERQVMEALLRYGETERIVQRRAFSLLDMKRLMTAMGFPSGGFRAELKDLAELDHPAIVPIQYAGFEHFVVVREIRDGRVFAADPAVGNISFTISRFREVWADNVLFIVFPGEEEPVNGLALREEDLRYIDDQTLTLHARMEFEPFHESLQWDIRNELERQKNNPDGSVENTRKKLHFRRR
ncbi:MAG: C39 family peptidase [Oleiphilaceae bacterium]|nr:C39 family peptidase [Oleiphilaceae bacterium]